MKSILRSSPISILHCNSHIQSLDINLRVSGDRISTSIHYKPTDIHSYLHHDSSHPRHCKESLPNSQFLRLKRLCSDNVHFLTKAQKMASFLERRSYNPQTLKQDLEKMKDLSQTNTLTKKTSTEKMSRIPLILTYHPLINRIKRILLDNFKVITDDPSNQTDLSQSTDCRVSKGQKLVNIVGSHSRQATYNMCRLVSL